MEKMTVRDVAVGGKRVLVRVDFNVPLDEKTGAIADDIRIRAAIPTINYLVEKKARVILISHLGRPKGKVPALSLNNCAKRLSELMKRPVAFAPDCIEEIAESAVQRLKGGDILLLENLRFHPEEELGNDGFAQSLARLADIYVDDAFGTAHRPHASITGVAKYLPAVAGLLLEKEVDTLGRLIKSPEHPYAALLGGAKVGDKVAMLENIIGKIDIALIGGAMAATFLKARSLEVGLSPVEMDKIPFANGLTAEAQNKKIRVLLPVDVVVSEELHSNAEAQVIAVDKIPPKSRIVDIGPQTIEAFSRELRKCQTIFWNGPMGIYEMPRFATGTKDIAVLLSKLDKAATIIGGGSTAEVVTEMGLADKMTFVSTGGGASLEFLSGQVLPGVAALNDKK